MKHIMIGFAVCLLVAACQKSQIDPLTEEKAFNKIGKKWVYNYYKGSDSLSVVMNVEITGDTIMPNGNPARVWEFQLPNEIFHYFVNFNQDTLQIFKDYSENPYYIIPNNLTSTSIWDGPLCGDSSTVVSQEKYTLGGNKYKNAWNIERHAPCGNGYLMQNIWWDCEHGFLRLESRDYYFGPVEIFTWELVESD